MPLIVSKVKRAATLAFLVFLTGGPALLFPWGESPRLPSGLQARQAEAMSALCAGACAIAAEPAPTTGVPAPEDSRLGNQDSLFDLPRLRRPAWPPRFDDEEPAPPSEKSFFRAMPRYTAPVVEGLLQLSGASVRSEAPSFGASGEQVSPSLPLQYPSTSQPEIAWESVRIRPIFDPMESEVTRLPPGGLAFSGVTPAEAFTSGASPATSTLVGVPENNSQPPGLQGQTMQPTIGQPFGESPTSPVQAAGFVGAEEIIVSDQPSEGPLPSPFSAWRSASAAFHTDHVGHLEPELCEQTQVLARVGSEVILAGEILGAVNEVLLPYRDAVPAVVYEQYKQQVMRHLLQKRIEMKLVYEDAKRKIPKESLQRIEQEIAKFFDEKEVPARLKKMGLSSVKEWEQRLRSVGSSLEYEKRAFIEGTLARDWVRQQLAANAFAPSAISPEMLWEYYEKHRSEFEQPAEVRWQQLMVRKRADRSDAESYAKLAELGNRVLRGEAFEEVAQSGSEGPTAANGGLREAVQPGSLRSRILEEALFSLPVGELSPILEDDQGFHIVRVLERREARTVPFTEAQVQIRERLVQEERQKQLADYLERLRREIPVWNAYENSTPQPAVFAEAAPPNGSPLPPSGKR